MQRVSDLKMPPEVGLTSSVLEHGRYHLDEYGHLTSIALEKDSNDWLAALLASNYWRIKGDVQQTVACLRKVNYFLAKMGQTATAQNFLNLCFRLFTSVPRFTFTTAFWPWPMCFIGHIDPKTLSF